jgi:hypothetical protein
MAAACVTASAFVAPPGKMTGTKMQSGPGNPVKLVNSSCAALKAAELEAVLGDIESASAWTPE